MNRPALTCFLITAAFGFLGVPMSAGQDPVNNATGKNAGSVAGSRLANVQEIRKQLGITPTYDNLPGIDSIKIAVLDYGFDGINGPRSYLPSDSVIVEHYAPEFVRRFNLGDPEYRKPFDPLNAHGRSMAQIVWAVTGFRPSGPKFYLLNANGPTMLRRAVRYAIENQIDVILFSNTFEGGGNSDGRGPINRIVADALAAGIIWINAAGNYGGHVYETEIEPQPNHFLRIGTAADANALRFRNLLDENTVTVTLTWNDYREQEDAGTSKDLDLYVQDHLGKVVGASKKKQVIDGNNAPEESKNPRERVVIADLPADPDHDYFIRIRATSGDFTPEDRLRVLITSTREGFLDPKTGEPTEAIRFSNASRKAEIYPPADNPLVITVGDMNPSSAVGPTADHRRKPDLLMEDSRASFTNGDVSYGASNAAAYFTGVVALLKAAEPGLRTRHLLWFAHNDKTMQTASELSPRQASMEPPNSQRSLTGVSSSRQGTLSRRLANLAAANSGQGVGGPLQIRAPFFEMYLDRRGQLSPQPGASSRQSFYAPLQIRAPGVQLNLPARASPLNRSSTTTGNENTSSNARQPESIRPPHKSNEAGPASNIPVWRTPTRFHLAEVVQDAIKD
jgi:hypothetical protein